MNHDDMSVVSRPHPISQPDPDPTQQGWQLGGDTWAYCTIFVAPYVLRTYHCCHVSSTKLQVIVTVLCSHTHEWQSIWRNEHMEVSHTWGIQSRDEKKGMWADDEIVVSQDT